MEDKPSLRTLLSRSKRKLFKGGYQIIDRLFDTDYFIRYRLHLTGHNNPEYTFNRDQICFMHLPKTGGSTLAKVLTAAPGNTFVQLYIHRPISPHCPPTEFKYITILREPVARVWSYYQMVLREYDGYPYQKYARRGLKTFLERSWMARNMNCRYLSGQVYAEPDKVTLEHSMDNLDKFYRVLLFEQLAEDITVFVEEEQLPLQALPHERKSSYDLPTAAQQDLIRRYNQLDIDLYESWLSKLLNRGDK